MGFQSLLEACVTGTGAIDFGRSGATGLSKQVRLNNSGKNTKLETARGGIVALREGIETIAALHPVM